MENISVLGFGSWGMALALVLHRNGHNVTVWARSQEKLDYVKKYGKSDEYLTDMEVPPGIRLSSDISVAAESDIIIFAATSRATRELAEKIKPHIGGRRLLVSASKGFEESAGMRLTEVLAEVLPYCDIVAFTGPGHAEEVAASLPTAYVAASENAEAAKRVQDAFMSDTLRVYTQSDVIGAELGAAIKNVIALAAGIADGMGYGDNLRAAIITRGLAEISRLGQAMGANPQTFAGLTGIGDLIVTCSSMHSRNRRCGILLGQGKSLDEALAEVHTVVEGVLAAKSALALSRKHNVEMPIVAAMNETLFEGKPPRQALQELMTRDKTFEW